MADILATDVSKRRRPQTSLRPIETASLAMPVKIFLISTMIPIILPIGSIVLNPHRIFLMLFVPVIIANWMGSKTVRFNIFDLLMVLHVVWSAIAISYWHSTDVIEFMGSNAIEFLGAYFLARLYITDVAKFTSLVIFLGTLVLFTLPLALYEALTGDPIIVNLLNKVPFFGHFPNNPSDPRLGLERVRALFLHPIHYGIFCSLAFSCSFIVYGLYTTASYKYIRTFFIGFCSFLSLSSGAFLSIILQLGLISWFTICSALKVPGKWKIFWAIVAFLYTFVEVFSNRTAIVVFLSYATFSTHTAWNRMIIFEFGMRNVNANPVFGIGLNEWERPEWMHSTSVDNFWLLMAMRYGVPAFLFLAVAVLGAVIGVIRNKQPRGSLTHSCNVAWVFTMSSLIFVLSTVHVWGSTYPLVFFFFGSGIWLLKAKADEDKATNTTAEHRKTSARGALIGTTGRM